MVVAHTCLNINEDNNIDKIRRLLLVAPFLLLTTGSAPAAFAASYANNHNSNEMKAWTCHGRNQRELVDKLCQAQIIQSPAVRDVMYKVDRKHYVPQNPYMDAPQAIGLGQTISAPHMHAHVLEEMYPYLQRQIQKRTKQQQPATTASSSTVESPTIKMLDVGCGSGYLTAALGRWIQKNGSSLHNDSDNGGTRNSENSQTADSTILGATGKVFGIDVYPHLINLTTGNMKEADGDLLEENGGCVKVQLGDGWKGLATEAPFDAIHVGAAAEELPLELLLQLKVGGVLIVPVGAQGDVQTLYRVVRVGNSTSSSEASSGSSTEQDETPAIHDGIKNVKNKGFERDDFRIAQLLGVRYVPLVHPANLDR